MVTIMVLDTLQFSWMPYIFGGDGVPYPFCGYPIMITILLLNAPHFFWGGGIVLFLWSRHLVSLSDGRFPFFCALRGGSQRNLARRPLQLRSCPTPPYPPPSRRGCGCAGGGRGRGRHTQGGCGAASIKGGACFRVLQTVRSWRGSGALLRTVRLSTVEGVSAPAMPLWVLSVLLLVVAACGAAPAFPGPSSKERGKAAASWDEVNVLAHGLLQLGHGLKEHVERTRGQLRELSARLSLHNASLALLERRTDDLPRLSRAQRLLDDRLVQLSRQLRAIQGELSLRPHSLDGSRTGQAGQENGSGSPRAPDNDALQSMMNHQNLRIEELFQKIKQQQYRMDKQNLQIKSLQSKVNMLIPLHIKENETQSPKWKTSVLQGANQASNHSQNARDKSPEASRFPEGCHQLFLEGERSSGINQIQPAGAQAFEVFCDMSQAAGGGGWTVIQRRLDGSVDFNQLWEAYKNGFGNMSGDFWLGLDKIHQIMQDGRFHLLIELQDWEGNSQRVQFLFSLGGEDTSYTLSLLGPIFGELENAMGDFPQLPFSTRDRDHDLKGDTNCAKHLSGGWWFSTCGHVNLNGKYFLSIPRQRHERKQGIFWKTWKGRYYPLKSTSMKIRPMELDVES